MGCGANSISHAATGAHGDLTVNCHVCTPTDVCGFANNAPDAGAGCPR